MANVYMKKCLTFPIREMQIKITLRLHLSLVRMAISKKTTTNAGMDAGENESLYTVGDSVN
jgi:hypothetical protein